MCASTNGSRPKGVRVSGTPHTDPISTLEYTATMTFTLAFQSKIVAFLLSTLLHSGGWGTPNALPGNRNFDWRDAVQTDEEACYLIAENVSLTDFRERLVNAARGE